MRIAILSDVHGYAVALEAVLADMQKYDVDRVVYLGDVATVGIQPLETLALLEEIPAITYIAGNHDAALLESGPVEKFGIASGLQEGIDWCRSILQPQHLQKIEAYLPYFEIDLDDKTKMLCFHGSPHSYTDILRANTLKEEIEQMFAGHTAQIWVGGHTHLPFLRQFSGGMIVNPGSVGAAFLDVPMADQRPDFLPWAQYAIITHEEGHTNVDFKRLRLHADDLAEIVHDTESPDKQMWLNFCEELEG